MGGVEVDEEDSKETTKEAHKVWKPVASQGSGQKLVEKEKRKILI